MAIKTEAFKYTFVPILTCEMCGDNTAGHKVLGQRLNQSQGLRPKSKFGITVSVRRCTKCGLIYCDPMPIPASIQDHYGIPPESYWRSVSFEWNLDFFSRYIAKAKKIIDFKPGAKALDIGSGLGRHVMSLEKSGFDAYGLEPSESFHEKSLEMTGMARHKIKCSPIEDADYGKNEFDFIVINAVAEHIYTPSASIAKALEWTRPGGVVFVSVPSADYLITDMIDFYFKVIGTSYTSHISPMHEPFHLFEFTQKSFIENAARSNYKIIDSNYDVCPIPFFPRFLHPILRKYMEMTNTGMDYDVWLQKN